MAGPAGCPPIASFSDLHLHDTRQKPCDLVVILHRSDGKCGDGMFRLRLEGILARLDELANAAQRRGTQVKGAIASL
jgi:hypothetical protein